MASRVVPGSGEVIKRFSPSSRLINVDLPTFGRPMTATFEVKMRITERVAPYGLTTLQFTTLSVLSRHGEPLSTSQLARRAFMTPQSMSEVIHALERKGLIKRYPDPTHRRKLPATITAKGRRVLAVCDQEVSEFEDSMLEGFSETDRAAFLEMVKVAVRNLGGGFPSE